MLRQFGILLPYLHRYAPAYVLGAVCVLGSVALKLLIPEFLGGAIDDLRGLQEERSLVWTPEVARLVARGAISIFVAAVAVAVVRSASRLAILGTCRRVAHDLRNVLFDHLLRLSPSFYVRNPTGQVMSRCVNDMQNVQGLMGPVILYLAETLILFVIGLAMMLRIDPVLTAVGVAPFPVFLVVARRLAVRIQTRSREAQNSLARISAKVDESLSGQMVIKTMSLEGFDRERFHGHCREYRALNLGITRDRAVLIPLMMALTSLSTIVVLGLGGPKVAAGSMSLGDLVAMMLYLQMLAGPTRTLGFVISSLRRGASALERIAEILETEVTLVDPPAGSEQAIAGDQSGVEVRIEGLDVVHLPAAEQPHLSGSLPDRSPSEEGADVERRVLQGVNLRVAPGATLGVVGHTGAGKTTLVRALSRQLEVEPGTIFVGGADVTRVPLRELRSVIGCVPQDAFLFSASLAENVSLGRPEAGRDEVLAALAAARLEGDLDQLPDGIDTVVGERGVTLSGGQRQRTALARVLLLDPRLLILDDTLSAVDTETADAILGDLRAFAAQRTTILVAHRLATVQHADEIVVLDEGCIVERGSHARLLELGGRYAALWNSQQRRSGVGDGGETR